MVTITVRNLDAELQQRLRLRAAQHGRSIEEETAPVKNLGTALHELFKPFGGVELDIPPREPMRKPPRFD